MIVELNDDPSLMDEGKISKGDIHDMVKHYRSTTHLEPLKYAHFRLEDILEFFKNSGVLPKKVIEALKDEEAQEHYKKFGLKIYMGRHMNERTCPPDSQGRKSRYLHKATTILVNTELPKKDSIKDHNMQGYKDFPITNFAMIGSEYKNSNGEYGLDKAEIEPPYHDGGYFDIGEE